MPMFYFGAKREFVPRLQQSFAGFFTNMADNQTPESSSTGTSSSSQSQSVPSSASMDSAGTAATLPTQDVVDGMSDEEEQKMCSWGRLFPLGIGFEKIGKFFSCCAERYRNFVRVYFGRRYS